MDALIKRSSLALIGLIYTAMSAGCATYTGPIHDYCLIARPICMKSGEPALLSDATDRQIDTHNETGKKICGNWKCK